MGFLQHTVDQAGELILSIPSALIIILSREWFCGRMTGDKESHPLTDFPLVTFACVCLTGTGPGGLLKDKPLPLLRFLQGQLWLLILVTIGVVYVMIKGPAPETFSARFSAIFLTQAWALLVINFIPIPPFDAAAIYFAPYMQWRMFSVVVATLAIGALILLSYDFWRVDFLTGKFLVRWLRLVV